MSARLSWVQHTLISLALGGLIGCSSLAKLGIAVPYLGDPPVSAIAKLPAQKPGAIVVIQGIVASNAPFLGSSAYQVKDQSGTVWIRTANPLPATGKTVTVKGKLDFQSIEVANQQVGEIYLVELEQLEPTAPPSAEELPLKPKPKKDPTPDLFLPHKKL